MFKIPLLALYAVTLGGSSMYSVQCMHVILSSLSQMFGSSAWPERDTHASRSKKLASFELLSFEY